MDNLFKKVDQLRAKLKIDEKKERIKEIEAESAKPQFWQDKQTAREKMKLLDSLNKEIASLEHVENLLLDEKVDEAQKAIESLEFEVHLGGVHDRNGAILSIHAGQGGTEAMDCAEMLYRMYTRYAEKRGWEKEEIEKTPGDEAGIKSVVLTINSPYAYGYLKSESGVHRLVRQSPFNADKLR